MKIKRHGSAVWRGGFKDGKGAISTDSGALKDYPYGFASRFEGVRGTNPEELIGAAHAGCFTMALSNILGEAKLTAEQMGHDGGSRAGTGGRRLRHHERPSHLEGQNPRRRQTDVRRPGGQGEAGCPVSKLLKAEITLEATLLAEPRRVVIPAKAGSSRRAPTRPAQH